MSKPWIDLTGQVALVTGASSGIGRAAAEALSGVGATVLAVDIDLPGAQAVADAIRAAGGKAEARKLDVTDKGNWDAVATWIEADFGRLDIVVNSAGVALKDSVGDASLETYHRTFAINVEGTLLGMEAGLRFMRRQGKGAIINLSSSASLRGNSLMAAYGASKAAVVHYTRSAAVENVRAGHDIRINAILPGVIGTPMAGDLYAIYDKIGTPEQAGAVFTTGREGRPEEVADLIVFLASDRASYIAGSSIVIDRAANA